MIDLLGAMRKIGRSMAREPAPAASPPDVPPQAGATGRHVALDREEFALAAQEPSDVANDGCDPYNSGMFDREDSWSRVNKRS